MLRQTPEQNTIAAVNIESLLNKELKSTVEYHINKYGNTFERRLGLSEDDLVNDIREQIWKGLLTHKKTGGANLKTYLNKLISNRFKVLLRRSGLKKYTSIDYFADVFSYDGIDQENLITDETGENLLERRQEMMRSLTALSGIERQILSDLMLGFKLNEMVQRNKIPLNEVIGAIKRIDETIRKCRSE